MVLANLTEAILRKCQGGICGKTQETEVGEILPWRQLVGMTGDIMWELITYFTKQPDS